MVLYFRLQKHNQNAATQHPVYFVRNFGSLWHRIVLKPIFIIFRPYLNIEGKSSTQRERFFFNVHLPIVRAECQDDSKVENLSSPNYRKFAVECD